jgi:hypothetical protein
MFDRAAARDFADIRAYPPLCRAMATSAGSSAHSGYFRKWMPFA